MPQVYRKAIGSAVWHFSESCTTWPIRNYTESQNPHQNQDSQLCVECTALQKLGIKKCPVLVAGKVCARDLIPDPAVKGFYRCSSGHSTRIIH